MYCLYYQAKITREKCWFFTAILRSHEHLAFDRTIDTKNSIFEFFVPELNQQEFEDLMQHLSCIGLVSNLQCLSNRIEKLLEK